MKNNNADSHIDSVSDINNPLIIRIIIFQYKGRMGRLDYFLIILITSLISSALPIFLVMPERVGFGVDFWIAIAVIIIFLSYISSVAIIKRCHDLGKTGWLYLVVLIPFVNVVLGLYLLFAKGMREANQYGPPLIGVGDASVGPTELIEAHSVPVSAGCNSEGER